MVMLNQHLLMYKEGGKIEGGFIALGRTLVSKLENAELYAPKHFENVYTLACLHILHMCLCVCLLLCL